ncbi:MAG: bifunctional metallophosphatase/5'-nucleotidase [Lachnospiraceae bacterium]|nr:bifunctional metallophosphatase/5'-nucleotidase [Lachnospiraceae bacterium]
MINLRKISAAGLAVLLALGLAACGSGGNGSSTTEAQAETTEAIQPVMIDSPEPLTEAPTPEAETQTEGDPANADGAQDKESAADGSNAEDEGTEKPAEKNGDVYILYTSDIHCGVDQGFGLAGLKQVRDSLEKQGYTTLLVDDGDAIQGEVIGTVTKGEAVIDLMNELGYDVAIPGNHEFDYGVDHFLQLTEKAAFPYISCNFMKEGEQVFASYIIKEAAGMKIAFVGVTTPITIESSTPLYFQNGEGEFIYSFLQEDKTGEAVYEALQKAVDEARAEGADYVYVMGHMGLNAACSPWTYADLISHTNGIDVFLDGHSHDTEQIVMKNKDGVDTARSACGTKMNCIGYSHISAEKGIVGTGIWSWPNKISAPVLLDIRNAVGDSVNAEMAELSEELNRIVAKSSVDLSIYDPVAKDASGNPIRIVRVEETNIGDFCADAFRVQLGADIALVNAGAIRKDLVKGDISYAGLINVFPFGNQATMIAATGQQILDALEWGAMALPDEFGGFLQVSGLSYEVDVSIPSPCERDEEGMMAPIKGKRRVQNVRVGDEPIDPAKTYTVGGVDYLLLNNGDGNKAFEGAELLKDKAKLDSQLLIDYISEDLGGEIGEAYEDTYGDGRITIIDD